MARAQEKTEARQDTRQQLLAAAERLFAEKGVNNVSMRQINIAAGQSNTGSVHYHFGAREALLEALLKQRMLVLNEEREAALARLPEHPAGHALVAVLIDPLLYRVERHREWQYYALVIREMIEFRHRAFTPLWQGKFDSAMSDAFDRMKAMAPARNAREWAILQNEAIQLTTTLVADRAQKLLEDDRDTLLDEKTFAAHLARLVENLLFEELG